MADLNNYQDMLAKLMSLKKNPDEEVGIPYAPGMNPTSEEQAQIDQGINPYVEPEKQPEVIPASIPAPEPVQPKSIEPIAPIDIPVSNQKDLPADQENIKISPVDIPVSNPKESKAPEASMDRLGLLQKLKDIRAGQELGGGLISAGDRALTIMAGLKSAPKEYDMGASHTTEEINRLQPKNDVMQVGNSVVQYNPINGKYEQVYKGPVQKKETTILGPDGKPSVAVYDPSDPTDVQILGESGKSSVQQGRLDVMKNRFAQSAMNSSGANKMRDNIFSANKGLEVIKDIKAGKIKGQAVGPELSMAFSRLLGTGSGATTGAEREQIAKAVRNMSGDAKAAWSYVTGDVTQMPSKKQLVNLENEFKAIRQPFIEQYKNTISSIKDAHPEFAEQFDSLSKRFIPKTKEDIANKVKVSNGKETLYINSSDLEHAKKDGYNEIK